MVHQHFMLIPTFTVVENVVLGSEPTRARGLSLDLPTARAALRDLSHGYGLEVDPDTLVREVPAVADRITVLRRGEVVGTARPAEATEQSLATMMVGRPVELTVEKSAASPGPDVLRVKG